MTLMDRLAARRAAEMPQQPGQCSNGGCNGVPSVLIAIGIRSTDERAVCAPCAESLRTLFPQQRELPGVPEWVRRLDRNAKALVA